MLNHLPWKSHVQIGKGGLQRNELQPRLKDKAHGANCVGVGCF